MNHTQYTNPMFPNGSTPFGMPDQQAVPPLEQQITGFPITPELSYIENILRLNRGKRAKFYLSFPDSVEWRDRVFTGIVEQAGRDHIIVSDPATGNWYLLMMIYLNYVEFDEEIEYDVAFIPPTTPVPPTTPAVPPTTPASPAAFRTQTRK